MSTIQQSLRLKVFALPIALVVAVVLAIFWVKPAYSDMMNAKKALNERKSQLESLRIKNQKLQSLKSKWQEMTEENSLVNNALPETDDLDQYVSEISSKAGRSGVFLVGLNVVDNNSGNQTNPSYVCGTLLENGMPSDAGSAGVPAGGDTGMSGDTGAGAAGSIPNCLQKVAVTVHASGTWEQILDFFKYLAEMNRISNVSNVAVSAGISADGQTAADLLSLDVSINAFFKKKSKTSDETLADSLVSQGNFNQKAIEKLKAVIYAPYEAPAVAPGGERNIFK